jgi:lipoprotein NlpD
VKRSAITVSLLVLSTALVVGCKSTAQLPPIEQMAQPPSIRLNYHIASRDDSLYTIAWRYGVDFRELAQRNRIAPPYRLHAGQKIMLSDGDAATRLAASRTVATPRGVQVTAVQDDQAVVEVASETPAVSHTSARATTASRAQPSTTVATKTPAAAQPETPAKVTAPAAVASGSSHWLWPTSGRVITLYSATDPLRKGIDLEGKLGDPVKAAGAGSVVYAGSGLAGYGQLIIIKHDDQFLSAYGHNSKLLVAEGDTVKKGQVIAEVGASGTDKNKLHFEIRKSGKPVDPLLYLPRR